MSDKPAAQNIPAALDDMFQSYKHKTGKKKLSEDERRRSVTFPLTEECIRILDAVATSRQQTRAEFLHDMVTTQLSCYDNEMICRELRQKIAELTASLEAWEQVGDKHVEANKA